MKTTREKIEIMEAYERGEQIELKRNGGKWHDAIIPTWIFLSIITISILLASCERAYNIKEYTKIKTITLKINKGEWIINNDINFEEYNLFYDIYIPGSIKDPIILVKLPNNNEYKTLPIEFSINKNNEDTKYLLMVSFDEFDRRKITLKIKTISGNIYPPIMEFKIITYIDMNR